MKKEELELKPYKELQELAQKEGLKSVGVSKEDLISQLTKEEVETPVEEGEVLGETTEYTPEKIVSKTQKNAEFKESEKKVPKVTTTKNFGDDSLKVIDEQVPVKYKVRTVRIKPRKNIPRSFIGNDIYELAKGKVYEVPAEVAEIFERGGYL